MRRSLLLTSVAVLTLISGTARAETLGAAVATALSEHPTVQAAVAERDLAKEQEREKYSDYFPQLNANAAAGRVYGDNSTSRGLTFDRGAGYSNTGEGSVSMRETIFNGMQTVNQVAAARERTSSADDNIIDVRENLALRAVLAYLDVLRSRESVAMIRDHNKKIADYRARIEKMVEDGGADMSMAVQAHDIQNQLDSTLADVEGQLNKAMAEYNEVMGHPVSDPMERPILAENALPKDAEQAVQLARDSHPALRGAKSQGVAADHDISAEQGTLYPSLTGEMSYYKKDVADLIGGEVTDARALVRMNWDFSTGGAQLAKIRQARERKVQTEAQVADLSGRIEREIRKAYAELDAAKTRMNVNRDRTGISKDLVATYEKQFEAAKVTLLNLLQAENTDFNARLGLLSADYRYQAAQYSVLANTGHLQDSLHIETVQKTAERLAPKAETAPVVASQAVETKLPVAVPQAIDRKAPDVVTTQAEMPVPTPPVPVQESAVMTPPPALQVVRPPVQPQSSPQTAEVMDVQPVSRPVDVAPVQAVPPPTPAQTASGMTQPAAQPVSPAKDTKAEAMRAKWLGHD